MRRTTHGQLSPPSARSRRGWRKWLQPRGPAFQHGVAAGLILGTAGGILSVLPPLWPLQEGFDLWALFRLRGPQTAPEDFALVSTDRRAAESISLPRDPAAYGRCSDLRVGSIAPTHQKMPPPHLASRWPRCIHERVLQAINAAGPRLVVLDISFRPRASMSADDSRVDQAQDGVLAQEMAAAGNVLVARRYAVWLPLLVPVALQMPAGAIYALGHHLLEANRKREELRRVFGKFLPDDVIDGLLDKRAALDSVREPAYGVCMATDAERFTSLAENMHPSQLARYLDRYFEAVFPPTTGHEGKISDVTGDAVQWALYYPPLSMPGAGPDEACQEGAQPDAAACLIHRAEQRLQVGRVNDAIADLDAAVAMQPANGDALALLSIIALAKNDRARASTLAHEATERSPGGLDKKCVNGIRRLSLSAWFSSALQLRP